MRNCSAFSTDCRPPGFDQTYHVLLLRAELIEARSPPPNICVTFPQPLANIGQEPFVRNLECAIIPALFGFPPKSPPWFFGGFVDNVAVSRDGDTGSSSAIAIGRDEFDKIDVFLISLKIGFVVDVFTFFLIGREAILHVKGDV